MSSKKSKKKATDPPIVQKKPVSKYKATLLGEDECEGSFGDFPKAAWSDYPGITCPPHPANEQFDHPNDPELPQPDGDYHIEPGYGTEGAPTRYEWYSVVDGMYLAEKDALREANPTWKPFEVDREAKRTVGDTWDMDWLNLRLFKWEGHPSSPSTGTATTTSTTSSSSPSPTTRKCTGGGPSVKTRSSRSSRNDGSRAAAGAGLERREWGGCTRSRR